MGRVVKALVAVFTAIVVGLFAIFALAKYRLEHARFTERLAIIADAPGFSVSTAENTIAMPLEQTLGGMQGLESMRTVIHPGRVVITVEVTAIGIDSPPPVQVVHDAMEKAVQHLPSDLSPPYITRLEGETIKRRYIAHTETMTRLELSKWLDQVFRRGLEVQPGVREIRFCGDVSPELKITLDQPRLRAVGLPANEVLNAIQSANVLLPGGRLVRSDLAIRVDPGHRLEELGRLELKGAQVRLEDVATLALSQERGPCTSARDVLVTLNTFPDAELKFPSHPDVTLTPFAPKHVATFMSPPGMSVEAALLALSRRYPDAMITAERDELTVFFLQEPLHLDDVPGLALRSMDDRHSVIEVKGPDFEQLTELAARARELLSKEKTQWLGVIWPGLAPEKVIKHDRAKAGLQTRTLSELLQLAVGGVHVGRLEDGTDIRVVAEASLEELTLPDGRRVTDVVEISEALEPAALLRVNYERTVELEVGLAPSEARRALRSLQLPQGYSVSVTDR